MMHVNGFVTSLAMLLNDLGERIDNRTALQLLVQLPLMTLHE